MATDRATAIAAVRQRVEEALVCTMAHDHETAMAAALAAMCARDSQPVFDVLFNIPRAKLAQQHRERIAITDSEFEALFGVDAVLGVSAAATTQINNPAFAAHAQSLVHALRCTLAEQRAKAAWARPATQLGCYLALHMDDAEERLSTCLGGVVRGDVRRLDDIRSLVEDNGADHMLLTQTVLALANVTCAW
tara:strand:+ start:1195 stop:1770 length:576 start_codon:yes stop_codon:yes gene_type:complete